MGGFGRRAAEVTMGWRALSAFGVAWAVLMSATAAAAEGLPACRVAVVRSAGTSDAPKAAFAQVQVWVDARERNVKLVPSIDEADVLLEFHGYRPTTRSDGTLADEWLFIARRLSEPNLHRATYRFAYVTWLDRRTKEHVARAMPTVLTDVCLGYLPKVVAERE
jgi:hypothetical protein